MSKGKPEHKERTDSADLCRAEEKTAKSVFKNKKYLLLMGAQAISNLGDWLYILALFVLVGFRWHATPLLISGMMLSLTAPMVVLGPFTGVLADRWNRTGIMLISNLAMALFVGTIPWLPSRWMLFAVLILAGVFESLFSPAEAGKLKEIVSDEQMQQATSVNSSITQLAKVIGPGLSGLLVATLGSSSAFWLDSLSFVLSSVLLLLTGFRTTRMTEAGENKASVEKIAKVTAKQRFMEGLNHIRRVRILFAGTLILTIAMFSIQLTDAQIVTLIRLVPDASSSLLGLIMALSGAGGLLGALLVNVIKWKSTSRIMAIGTIGCGIGLGGSALLVVQAHAAGHIGQLWMAMVIGSALGIGACAGLIFIPFQTTAQRSTPSRLTGRVFGTIGSLTTAAALLGPALGGIIVTFLGVVNGFIITSAALIVMGTTVLITRRWLDREPAAVTAEDSVQA